MHVVGFDPLNYTDGSIRYTTYDVAVDCTDPHFIILGYYVVRLVFSARAVSEKVQMSILCASFNWMSLKMLSTESTYFFSDFFNYLCSEFLS